LEVHFYVVDGTEEEDESRRHTFLQEEARMLSPIYRAADQSGHAWRKRAYCADVEPDIANYWFADDSTTASGIASVICFTKCPVREDCLKWASEAKQRFGIWGGLPASVRLQKVSPPGADKGRPHDYDTLVELPLPYITDDTRSRFHISNMNVWQGEEAEDE
jgi:WhiB family redox-sensing transcriptional regulator